MSRGFDAIIIGAGQAGPPLAGRLTAEGMSVALIERHLIGGTCVNTGCMPTKAMVASAYAAHLVRRAGEYGVGIGGDITVDMARVQARAHGITRDAREGNTRWLEGMERLTLIRGHARFTGPSAIEVDGERLTAPRIFLNVGGRALVPDLPGVDRVPFLTNSSILQLTEVPEHLLVVGGSYIGLEFAQMFRRFGARVSVVERSPRIVMREDEDVSEALQSLLEDEGIAIRTGAECIRLQPGREGGVAIAVDCADGPPVMEGSHLLLAVGRVPNTADLGLDAAGVETDARGYVTVDEHLKTSADGVWALGDCNGRGAFTHTAYNDYEIVAANLLDGANRKVGARVSGYALYTDPPLGRVGMSESEARKSGRPLLIAKRPMSRVGRAKEKGETKGFMKLIADAETHRILGAAILGTGGDEAIHGILDAVHAGMDYRTLRWAVPIHPTVSELIPTLIMDLAPA
ncbi:FAD-containing oxidoreductase [Allosphingosinicella indica]|uniref:Pyruvate/2-oxoglutarate dehydrogenase complex, dihydrolipoamide dehydrogenase (E3) component n=1 Tax=Allosphingosinicella indica TaxID=941907 RepID=A0A1X7GCI3_9SPHN|nr:FAD-containing oxidoreductase [Allosphingosinicella indica]SMF67580.1 Pyruvate/2-oxoglutarate dehydrogenase complex, dihydrolipoamide dehydrogenase (E3) component [Allosphingosinicella indica]